ncbi:MAG: HAD-IA family hydrolase [Clostridiaceae bacterium]
MKKIVVFDFDGVIIDSRDIQIETLIESYNAIVGEGTPCIEEFFKYSGDSLSNIFRKMGLPKAMVKAYRNVIINKSHRVKVFEGMRDLLKVLNNQGFDLGLCTGKDRERTIELLNKLELIDYFKTIVCSDDVKNPKPHPESLRLCIKNLNGSYENCIMVGDAKNDMICSRSIGVTNIAVTWGENDRKTLLSQKPNYIVDNHEELYECIISEFQSEELIKKKYIINDFVVSEDNCNMSCAYCLTGTSNLKENHKSMKIKKLCYEDGEKLKHDIDVVLERISSKFDIPILKISGGELLLIKGINNLIKEQSKKYKVIQVLTNGVLLNEELLKEFKDLGNVCLQISIDHHTFEGNIYRTRNKKVLDNILANIDKVVSLGIPLEINCVLTDKNTLIIDQFAEYLLKYDNGVMLFPFPIRGVEKDQFYPSKEHLNGLEKIINNYERYKKIIAPKVYLEYLLKFLQTGKREFSCNLPGLSIGTFEDGSVTPCANYWFKSVANILKNEKQLNIIGEHKLYKMLLVAKNKFSECSKCFTPWETLNLYIEGKLSLDELCNSPLYNFPGVREYIVASKIKVSKEINEYMEYSTQIR